LRPAPIRTYDPFVRRIVRTLLAAWTLVAVIASVIAASSAAHIGAHVAAGVPAGSHDVKLRECWLSVAMTPSSPAALEAAFGSPLDLTQTFYGPDPLVGIWGMACDRARVDERRIDRVILSLVGAPTGLTIDGAAPLANNFAHALLRADTDSRALAKSLRRRGLPGRFAGEARFRHSAPERVPSVGGLVVPGRYRLEVSATALDPTNPHDHVNSFDAVRPDGRPVNIGLFTDDAFDRFCFPSTGDCEAFVRAHRRSPLRELLGDGSAVPRVGFDHVKISRLNLLFG
jgi:hypothetical protein